MKTAKGNYMVFNTMLPKISSEWLPKKFVFKPSDTGKDIEISLKDFSISCRAILIDAPGSLSAQLFLICFRPKKESKSSYSILSLDDKDEKNILLDEFSDYFYTEKMVQSGFIAVRLGKNKLKWKLLFVSGEHKGLLVSLNSFTESEGVSSGNLELIFKSRLKYDLRYNGVSGKILEMLFAGTILSSYRVLEFGKKIYITVHTQDGANIMEIGTETSLLLEESIVYLEILDDKIEEPNYHCTYFNSAIKKYQKLIELGIKQIITVVDKPESECFFNFIEKRYLSPEETRVLQVNIDQYKHELFEAKEFDSSE